MLDRITRALSIFGTLTTANRRYALPVSRLMERAARTGSYVAPSATSQSTKAVSDAVLSASNGISAT